MIGVHVPQDVKAEFERVAKEMDSSSSALGNTLVSEFLREYERVKVRGKVVWPIQFHLAYHPAPVVRFGDESEPVESVPRVAEGAGQDLAAAPGPEKCRPGTVYRPEVKKRVKN